MQARLSIQDVGYNGLTDSVKFGKILAAMRLLKSSDCYYVRIRQLAVVVLFPFVIVAAFFYLVVRVSLCIAKEVMGGVAAFPIVALVQNVQAVRYRAVDRLKCNAMRSKCFKSGTFIDGAVTSFKYCALPFPAGIVSARFVYLRPETGINIDLRPARIPARPRAVFSAIGWGAVVGSVAFAAFAFSAFLFHFVTI